MTLLDRHILIRFLANFAILFALLFVFATSIDLILVLDRFVKVARRAAGEDAAFLAQAFAFIRIVVDFQAPRFFQFYAYLHGLIAVGAMGFTVAQMHRYKELIAMLAAGISMHRIAMPFIIGVFALSALQLFNQELLLPRVAPLLLRDHGQIGQSGVDEFPVRFTPDATGSLLQAPTFSPHSATLTRPTILERDERGRTTRRITGESATWIERTEADGTLVTGWQLTEGQVVHVVMDGDRRAGAPPPLPEKVTFYPTDLSPRMLVVRRFGEYASMLSLSQIAQMLRTPGVVEQKQLAASLHRCRFSRFASVLVNVLVMWFALPAFLIREPSNLLMRTMLCAGTTIPAMLGAAIFMMIQLPGISPAVAVFLPVLVLLPVVLARWTFVRT